MSYQTDLIPVRGRALFAQATPRPTAPEAAPLPARVAAAWEATRCLGCRKPPRPGSCFCSENCKTRWQAGMNAWQARLPKTPIEGQQEAF